MSARFDRIVIKDLQVFARHGVLPEEGRLGQRFAIDVTAWLDLRPAGRSDDEGLTVRYDHLTQLVIRTLTERRYALIEAAAESVADAALAAFPLIERIAVELRKPAAPIEAVFGYVAVAIERTRNEAGDPGPMPEIA